MTERKTLTFQQKKELYDEYKRRKEASEDTNQEELAKWCLDHFKLEKPPSQSTISRILKRQQQYPISATNYIHKRERVGKNHALEQALFAWVEEQANNGNTVNGIKVRNAAIQFQARINETRDEKDRIEMKFSNGWLSRFQTRWGIQMSRNRKKTEQKKVQESTTVDADIDGYDFSNVWCAADIGLCFRMAPSKTLARMQLQGSGKEKGRIACVLCCNADGTERMPIMMVGREEKPESFQGKSGKQLGFDYYGNRKAWMSTVLFCEWLQRFDKYIGAKQGRKVLLLMRNYNAGDTIDKLPMLHCVKVVFMGQGEQNALEEGIVETLKVRYRKLQIGRVMDLHDCNSEDVYTLDQLTAMRWISMTWKEISSDMIVECWRRTRLLRGKMGMELGESKGHLEKLQREKQELEGMITKIVGAVDRMPLTEFLNSSAERETEESLTEDQLIDSIVDSVTASKDEEDEKKDSAREEREREQDISKQLEAIATAKIIIESSFADEKELLERLRSVQSELRRKKFGSSEETTTAAEEGGDGEG